MKFDLTSDGWNPRSQVLIEPREVQAEISEADEGTFRPALGIDELTLEEGSKTNIRGRRGQELLTVPNGSLVQWFMVHRHPFSGQFSIVIRGRPRRGSARS
jgi:hypothetical protein